MSEAMGSDTERIYIPLLDEGTVVVRPTRGVPLAEGIYRVLATATYDPEDENWEFPPGSIVRCVLELRNGHELLVARELATHQP